MKGRTLAVLAVLCFVVVGYAVYATVGGGRDRPKPSKRKSAGTQEKAEEAPIPAKHAKRAPAKEEPPPRPVQPPVVEKPDMTVAEAREEYDAFIAELDREITRGEEVGRAISNDSWVEYYKRGHETMDPLIKLLDRSVPEHNQELNDKHELIRKKLRELQPRSQ